MDVAKNVRNPGLSEAHLAGRTTLVQAQIDGLPLMDRKHIVEERILIGELDDAAGLVPRRGERGERVLRDVRGHRERRTLTPYWNHAAGSRHGLCPRRFCCSRLHRSGSRQSLGRRPIGHVDSHAQPAGKRGPRLMPWVAQAS